MSRLLTADFCCQYYCQKPACARSSPLLLFLLLLLLRLRLLLLLLLSMLPLSLLQL